MTRDTTETTQTSQLTQPPPTSGGTTLPGRPEGNLATLNADISSRHFLAGWDRQDNPPMWPQPQGTFVPAVWRYQTAARMLATAGRRIPPEKSERRNLIMVNPSEGNTYPTVRTQVLAYQMVLPGEQARTHRHSPHAGRLILDAEGAHTIVDGVSIPMRDGDVVLTPSMRWHGHGHDGDKPAYWVDFLDIPLVQLLEPMFFEPYPGDWQPPERTTRDSPLLFPYEETKRRLDATEPDPDGFYGRRVQLGDPALPTVGLHMQRLDRETTTTPLRTTANWQYVVVEGEGSSFIDGVDVTWSRGDTFVAPAWRSQRHHSDTGATLLAITDEPLQRYCGYLRAEAAAEAVSGAESSPHASIGEGFRAG